MLLTGPSGGGKSTLLRIIAGLIPRFYGGNLQGKVELLGREISQWSHLDLCKTVGFLFQDPESQIVTNRVDHEVIFGLENIGCPRPVMKERLEEVGQTLNLKPWLRCPTPYLSGGWKQKTVLGSVLAPRPRLLLLDEPLSQMDQDSVGPFLDYLEQCRRWWGMSIIMAEHRLEMLGSRMDSVITVCQGRIGQGSIRETDPKKNKAAVSSSSPAFIKNINKPRLAGLDQVDFYYHPRRFILNQLSLDLQAGDLTVLMGANGSGKTTLLKLLMGLIKPVKGRVDIGGEEPVSLTAPRLAKKVGYLSQEPGDYLFSPTVREEIEYTCSNLGLVNPIIIETLLKQLHLEHLAHRNPRDLSWGERQRTALASILAAQPGILLLDEPTRGLDPQLKSELGYMLRELVDNGMSVLLVTHDQCFAERVADRIFYLEKGKLCSQPTGSLDHRQEVVP